MPQLSSVPFHWVNLLHFPSLLLLLSSTLILFPPVFISPSFKFLSLLLVVSWLSSAQLGPILWFHVSLKLLPSVSFCFSSPDFSKHVVCLPLFSFAKYLFAHSTLNSLCQNCYQPAVKSQLNKSLSIHCPPTLLIFFKFLLSFFLGWFLSTSLPYIPLPLLCLIQWELHLPTSCVCWLPSPT